MSFAWTISVHAEDTIDALEKDLQDVKQAHQETSAKNMSDFLAQTLAASQSPDAALDLYRTAGGAVPDGTPIQTQHARETTQEKADREAQDAEKLSNLAMIAQLHCGMLRYAGLFVTDPNQKGLQDEWVAWLKAMPQIFTQIKDDDGSTGSGSRQIREQTRALKRMTMKESVISTYFNFYSWGDKEQGGWSVNDLPGLYRSQVLEPLRTTPNADTLAAWDIYISLKSATQPDQNKWTVVEYPALMFSRGSDDYAGTPTMDKLQVLVELIKANPNCPSVDDMIGKVHDLLKDYRTRHPGAATPQTGTTTASGSTTPADSNVSVSTAKDGDMTIVTTHTNAQASNPPTPPQ